ncbi:MAG: shikimate dehydrogenase [Bacteroidota bacterium]
MTASTGLVVLLGDPVRHSASPAIHNAAFRERELDLAYLACRVEADRLGEAMGGLHALGAHGANVTIPHKAQALRLANSAAEAAQALGAANTLVRTEAGWHAENTDVEGFLGPLEPHGERLDGGEAVVLGAGGAARAVVYGLLTRYPLRRLRVVARRPAQAEALLADLEPVRGTVETGVRSEAGDLSSVDLLVNTTPLGMGDGQTPYAGPFRAGQVVYDLVYRPLRTPLLGAAETAGATTIGGLPMLLGQAAASFRLWTGHDMPLDVAEAAALATFG